MPRFATVVGKYDRGSPVPDTTITCFALRSSEECGWEYTSFSSAR